MIVSFLSSSSPFSLIDLIRIRTKAIQQAPCYVIIASLCALCVCVCPCVCVSGSRPREEGRAMENGVYPVVTEPIYDGHCDSDDCIRIRGGTV